MKIAVTSQNRKTVTANAGRCRRFWLYEIEDKSIKNKTLIDLAIDQSFHATEGKGSPELQGIHALITGGMGENLIQRLKSNGIDGVITEETDPDVAVDAYLKRIDNAK